MTEVLRRLTAALADRYNIERELGAGGMATVYLADDLKHERKVAIKVLRPELAHALGPERFLREIRIAAQLQHPHILPLLESGEADGFLYYVMPYVKGQSLRERLAREGELPVTEAVRLLTEVVDALALAHEHGVVHRDIKPDNVMLSGRHALVMDFGVAKAISEAARGNSITTLGIAVGTPAYMSPEQAAADPHVDHRSDIYSVGVMAYEMLTGAPPFTGTTPQQVLAAQVTEAPDPVSKRRATIPPALEAIVMKCLAKRPADRWQTAGELLAQLEPLLTPSGGVTPTTTRPVIASSSSRRRGAIVIGSVVIIVLAVVITMLLRRPSAVAAGSPVPVQLTHSGKARDISMSPDGAYIAYHEARACEPGTECKYWNVILQETSANGTRTVVDSGLSHIGPWSPDSKRYLLLAAEGSHLRLSVRSVLGGEVVHDVGGPAAWAGSSDTLLVWNWPEAGPGPAELRWIRTVNVNTLVASDSFRFGTTNGFISVTPSPDGRFLLISYFSSDSSESLVDAIVSRRGAVLDSLDRLNPIRWGLRSDRVYFRREPGTRLQVIRQDIDRNGRRSGPARQVADLDATDISPVGNQIAYVQRGTVSELWTLDWKAGRSHEPVKQLIYQTTANGYAYPSPDGSHVFVWDDQQTGDSTISRLLVIPFAGGDPVPFASLRLAHAMDFDLSRDESRAIIAERRNGRSVLTLVTNLRSGTGREFKTTFADSGGVWILSDHRYLWGAWKKPLEVATLDDQGAVLGHFPWPDSLRNQGIRVSPDGSAIAVLSRAAGGDSSVFSLYQISLPAGKVFLIAGPLASDGSEFSFVGNWSSDGWLPLEREYRSGRRMLMRIGVQNGKQVVDGPVPILGDDETLRYDDDRRRATEWVTNHRSDIFLLRDFDPDP